MELRLPLHARLQQALIALLALALLGAGTPKARQLFERGLAAYKKHDYKGAADAFHASYDLSPSDDTLFAWAQAERLAGHCPAAVPLFDKLLTHDLPSANKAAIRENLDKCPKPKPEPKPEPEPEPEPASAPAPAPAPARDPDVSRVPSRSAAHPAPWYRDPVGLSLLATGTASFAVGAGFLLAARAADQDKADSANHFDFVAARDRAEARGTVGVVTLAAGVALLAGGLAWYALAPDRTGGDSISLWMDEGATTFVFSRRF